MSQNPSKRARRKKRQEKKTKTKTQDTKVRIMDTDVGELVNPGSPNTSEEAFASYAVRLYKKDDVFTVCLADNRAQMALYQGDETTALKHMVSVTERLKGAFADFINHLNAHIKEAQPANNYVNMSSIDAFVAQEQTPNPAFFYDNNTETK